MENSNKEVISKLNQLIAIAEDGKLGYESAAQNVSDPIMKKTFQKRSAERESYSAQLKQQVSNLGGKVDDGGGPLGAVHRTWINLKSAMTAGDREAIINACITGEEVAVKEYRSALEESYINGSIRVVVSAQYKEIESALTNLKSLTGTPAMAHK